KGEIRLRGEPCRDAVARSCEDRAEEYRFRTEKRTSQWNHLPQGRRPRIRTLTVWQEGRDVSARQLLFRALLRHQEIDLSSIIEKPKFNLEVQHPRVVF